MSWAFQPLLPGAATLLSGAGVTTLTADPGAFTMTGNDAALLWNRAVTADPGTFTLTGNNATLLGPGDGGSTTGVGSMSLSAFMQIGL